MFIPSHFFSILILLMGFPIYFAAAVTLNLSDVQQDYSKSHKAQQELLFGADSIEPSKSGIVRTESYTINGEDFILVHFQNGRTALTNMDHSRFIELNTWGHHTQDGDVFSGNIDIELDSFTLLFKVPRPKNLVNTRMRSILGSVNKKEDTITKSLFFRGTLIDILEIDFSYPGMAGSDRKALLIQTDNAFYIVNPGKIETLDRIPIQQSPRNEDVSLMNYQTIENGTSVGIYEDENGRIFLVNKITLTRYGGESFYRRNEIFPSDKTSLYEQLNRDMKRILLEASLKIYQEGLSSDILRFF